MATKLSTPLIRDTGLKSGKKPVFVTMIPTKDGGALVLKEKGKRGKGVTIPLKTLLEPKEDKPEKKKRKPVMGGIEDPKTVDLIDLGYLETRIMMDGADVMTDVLKGRISSIIREIRDERREYFGFESVNDYADKLNGKWED